MLLPSILHARRLTGPPAREVYLTLPYRRRVQLDERRDDLRPEPHRRFAQRGERRAPLRRGGGDEGRDLQRTRLGRWRCGAAAARPERPHVREAPPDLTLYYYYILFYSILFYLKVLYYKGGPA